jgi:hypothetical protein
MRMRSRIDHHVGGARAPGIDTTTGSCGRKCVCISGPHDNGIYQPLHIVDARIRLESDQKIDTRRDARERPAAQNDATAQMATAAVVACGTCYADNF